MTQGSSDPGSNPGGGGSSAGGGDTWPEEKVYRIKHLKQIVLTKPATDAGPLMKMNP